MARFIARDEERIARIVSRAWSSLSACPITRIADANASGVIHFCGVRETPLNGEDQPVYKVVFRGLQQGEYVLAFDQDDDQFNMDPPDGESTNIYAASLEDGQVDIYYPLYLTYIAR